MENHDQHDHSHPLLKSFYFTLSRKLVEDEQKKRLQDLAKKSKMQGFRPGKAPMSLIKKRYGESVLDEIIDDMAKKQVDEKMNTEKLNEKLASKVSFHPSASTEEELKFHAHYEIFPEFELALDQMPTVKKPAINIDEDSIDQMINWMCRIYGEDKPADITEKTDRITMSFQMCLADKPDSPLLNIDPYQFVIPLHKPDAYIDFPASPLIGKKVGDKIEWTHEYAEDFANPLVAGQKILLKATIHSIVRKEELKDEVLFERLGLKEKDSLQRRAEIRKQLESQVLRRVNSIFTARVGKALRQAHDIEVPPSMFQGELQQQSERMRVQLATLKQSTDASDKSLLKRLEVESKKQIQSQIVWLKISESISEKVGNEEVLQEIRSQCEEYEAAEEAYQQMIQNREELMKAYETVQQRKMIEWLVPQIKVEDDKVPFSEFMIG